MPSGAPAEPLVPRLEAESLAAPADAANNGAGLIRLTVSGLTAGTGPGNTDLTAENSVEVYGVTGTTEANGNWAFSIVDATHIDLIGSAFVHAYAGGGAIGGALDQLPFSLDSISTGALAQFAGANTAYGLPLQNLAQYQSLLTPLAQLGSQTSGSGQSTSTQSVPLSQQLIGGAIGGVGLLGALGGLPTGGLFGGIGRMINNGTWPGGTGNGST
jgi:hypothetical protein